jgi:hypothetical protein
MVAGPKRELHSLIDRLSDEQAAEAIRTLRHLTPPPGDHNVPVLRRGRPIDSIDELAGDVFPPEETTEEFDSTIRRWRREGTPSRG